MATLTEAVREINNIRAAEAECREVLGPVSMSFDSAADVYKAALEAMGIDTYRLHRSAYRPVYEAARRGKRQQGRPLIGMDAAGAKGFAERFPGAARIRAL